MVIGMPVLGEDLDRKMLLDAVDHGHNLVAIGDCQRAIRTEVVLYVDHQQGGVVVQVSNL